jgi:hypothetical protein
VASLTPSVLEILEGSDLGERLLFESAIPQNVFGRQRRELSNLFTPTFNQFLGQIGSQMRLHDAPTLTWKNFLQRQFDPQRQLLRLPSISPSSTSPVTPTVFNFPR